MKDFAWRDGNFSLWTICDGEVMERMKAAGFQTTTAQAAKAHNDIINGRSVKLVVRHIRDLDR